MSMPHVYASQIEYMSNHLNYRENVIFRFIRTMTEEAGVADAELVCSLAVRRVEGTLFGNGERTGNVDIDNPCFKYVFPRCRPEVQFDNIPEFLRSMRC